MFFPIKGLGDMLAFVLLQTDGLAQIGWRKGGTWNVRRF